MSFNIHARNVLDTRRPIWRRWSSLHSCLELIRHLCPPGTFPKTHARWVEQWNISRENSPTDAQLCDSENVRTIEKRNWRRRGRGETPSEEQ